MIKEAKYFLDKNIKIHISLISKKFYNGYIKEIKEDYILFQDDVLGELPVWFSKIKEDGMDPFTEVQSEKPRE